MFRLLLAYTYNMGEARRRAQEGLLPPKSKMRTKKKVDDSPRLVQWLPVTEKQRDQFFDVSIKAGWVGIGTLVVIWLVVRFIGPAAGWWVPADLH